MHYSNERTSLSVSAPTGSARETLRPWSALPLSPHADLKQLAEIECLDVKDWSDKRENETLDIPLLPSQFANQRVSRD